MLPLLVVCALAVGRVAPYEPSLPPVVSLDVVAIDPAAQRVGVVRLVDGGARSLEVHDLAQGAVVSVHAVVDGADVDEALAAAALVRAPTTRVESRGGVLRFPLEGADVEVEVSARPPTPGEIETDPALRAWRDAREREGRAYASNEVLVVLATISSRVVARRAFEIAPGRAVEPSAPYAFRSGDHVAVVAQLRSPAGDALFVLPLVDLADAVRRLDRLPKDDARVVAEAKNKAVDGTLPPPDDHVEVYERDPAEFLCCGVPMLGAACATMKCLDFFSGGRAR